MADLRKIAIIFVIAVLYAIFVTAFIDAVYEQPDYDEFCSREIAPRAVFEKPVNCEPLETVECSKNMVIVYEYDEYGCASSASCSSCSVDWEVAREDYNFVVFLLSSVFGLVAIAGGLYLPIHKRKLNEWIATGFMFGGLIALFIGTARYYADMARMVRPVVMLVELVIVIYVAYRKIKE